MTWTLQDAKNRFSAVVRAALEIGPQRISRHGRDAVVVLAAEEYERLTAPAVNLVASLRQSPLTEAFASGELRLERESDFGRDLEL